MGLDPLRSDLEGERNILAILWDAAQYWEKSREAADQEMEWQPLILDTPRVAGGGVI